MAKNPNFFDSLSEMDAGIFARKLTTALAQTALASAEHKKKGKITITLEIAPIGDSSHQVTVAHTLSYAKPTLRGESSEKDSTTTPMYVNRNGLLSVAPDMQTDIFKPQHETN